ncbi:MAG: hypothetical protein M3O70_00520 [Actinomycetota bacterium]|nr:hypothetical protein [Actinomycetota bacterium]
MKLYAELPGLRARQLLSDLALVLWVFLWVRVGMEMYELVNRLQGPGRTMEQAGDRFADTLQSVSGEVGDLPLIGPTLGEPFQAAAEAGRALQQAGATQQEVVQQLALWLAILLAAIPIVLVLSRYLPRRLRWLREAEAARGLRLQGEHLYLFALRAAVNRPLHELRRAHPDPAGALAAGDYEALAILELQALGLRIAPQHRMSS